MKNYLRKSTGAFWPLLCCVVVGIGYYKQETYWLAWAFVLFLCSIKEGYLIGKERGEETAKKQIINSLEKAKEDQQ